MAQAKEQSLPAAKTGYTREFTGLFLFFWAIFLTLALVSFDKTDPTMNHVRTVTEIHNKAGLFGAYVSGFLNEWFGLCSFLWPLFFVAIGCPCLSSRLVIHWRRWVGIFLLVLFLMETGVAWHITVGDFSSGGILGTSLYQSSVRYLNPWGASLFWFFIFLIATQLIINISWINVVTKFIVFVKTWRAEFKARQAKIPPLRGVQVNSGPKVKAILSMVLAKLALIWPKPKVTSGIPDLHARKSRQEAPVEPPEEDTFFQGPSLPLTKVDADEDVNVLDLPAQRKAKEKAKAAKAKPVEPEKPKPKPEPAQAPEKKKAEPKKAPQPELTFSLDEEDEPKPEPKKAKPVKAQKVTHGPYPLPPVELLTPPVVSNNTENLEAKAQVLMQTLHEFNIEAQLVAITPGPVVTLFEVRPATGVRVSKFQSLSDDLARVLMATAVRILAPVPGSDTVGIEIPNVKREIVNFRELITAPKFKELASPLTMVLGKDTTGNPVYADLAKMPHMLIAGATGTGKSVCLNCILASLLYRTQPDEVKLLLVDPKRVEMSVYADEPHLIHPVVNEPSDAKTALEWATHEMDERFKLMAKLSVRNITGFNKRLATYAKGNRPAEIADLEPMPYIAIVIDELADLMLMSDRSEVEKSILRLAQLGRASGVHMILATQRPSVNVVTGLIKTNFPCRISFKVSSNADSRTILDTPGAEKLLGMGDMLYRPGDTNLHRLHGAFLSDEEVCAVIEHWKAQAEPSYKVDFATWDDGKSSAKNGKGEDEDDELYPEVVEFVYEEGAASISKIQRRFKIGFNRAARLVDAMEANGILEPSEGGKPRKVRQ